MTYRIRGLDPGPFVPLFAMGEGGLTRHRAARRVSDGRGFPCRISLEDSPEGEEVVLVNFVSHDVDGPFRSAYAIYVRADVEPACYEGELPPILRARRVALRQFDSEGRLIGGEQSDPVETDAALRRLLARDGVASIHIHNPTYGCFLAKAERS